MLSAATAGLLAVPLNALAQSRQGSSATQPTAATTSAPATGESAVQQELRRLYSESGREMPDAPTNIQMAPTSSNAPVSSGTPAPNAAPASSAAPASGAAPAATATAGPIAPPPPANAPAPSAPSKANPVASFFKKLVPGGSHQKSASTMTLPPRPSAPIAQVPKTPVAPRYSPYTSTPPRRLPTTDATAAAPAAPQATAKGVMPIPPSPSPAPTTAATVVPTQAPQLTAPTQKPAPVAQPIVVQKPAVIVEKPPIAEKPSTPTAPETAPQVADSNEPTTESPFAAAVEPPEPPVAMDDFPDPFTEVSESEADGKRGVTQSAPFAELDEEEPAKAAVEKAEEDPFADAAISTEKAEEPLPGDAPVLPPAHAEPSTQPITQPNAAPAVMPKLAAEPKAAPPLPKESGQDEYVAKMNKIRERGGMKGLKGFCPVTLRDSRELKDALSEFQSSYRGQKFHFASAEAKEKFDADPPRYAPAAYGADIVVLIRDKDVAEGTLDFAAWFKGRLYLFSSEDTNNAFLADPAKYAAVAGLE